MGLLAIPLVILDASRYRQRQHILILKCPQESLLYEFPVSGSLSVSNRTPTFGTEGLATEICATSARFVLGLPY